MKILLTGSTGFIGSHIKQALEDIKASAGYELITPSHHEADYTTFLSVEHWLPLLEGVDVVINSVGIIVESKQQRFSQLHTDAPIALFKACQQMGERGVKRVIQLSALGADEQAFTAYQKSKLKADDYLRRSSLSWFVLRPSLVYGEGGTSLKLFKRLALFPVIPLTDAGQQQIQPVHVSDLVATVMHCLQSNVNDCQTIDVVGAKAISFADYLQAIRASLGKSPALVIRLSYRSALLFSQFAHRLFPLLHPDNLRMLQQGNTADSKPLTKLLGRPPLSVEQGLALTATETTKTIKEKQV